MSSNRLPEVGKLSIPGKKQADLAELVQSIEVTYTADQMAELTIIVMDPLHKLTGSPLAAIGTVITFDGSSWQVGAIDAELLEWGSLLTYRCRDPLAKGLRKTYKTSAEQKVSPGDWVTRRVKLAGGRITVQPSSKRATISQSKSQSVLDVISSLASDLDWSWVSYAGRMIFASRYYAWQGKVGLPAWKVSWKANAATDALTATWSDSDDNAENRAELEISLPYDFGIKLRPWHRIVSTIPGAKATYLVEEVTITYDGVSPVEIRCTIPKPPGPKAGSSSKEK